MSPLANRFAATAATLAAIPNTGIANTNKVSALDAFSIALLNTLAPFSPLYRAPPTAAALDPNIPNAALAFLPKPAISPSDLETPGPLAATPPIVSINDFRFSLSASICCGSILSAISIFSEAKNERKQPFKTVF